MIRIGVLSDTHLIRVNENLRRTMDTLFSRVDMLIHAGDMVSREVYDYLSTWNLIGVRGNMDDYEVREILPDTRIEQIEGKRIGIMHGRGGPAGIEELVLSEFTDVDLIIFGHSHIPLQTMRGDRILFNPGSFGPSRGYAGTVGLLEISHTIRLSHLGAA